MKFQGQNNVRGVTMVEMMVVIAVIASAIGLAKVGITITNGFAKQSVMIEAQKEVEVALYQASNDIRSCQSIIEASSTTHRMKLVVFNTSRGFDTRTNPTLFTTASTGTITYEYLKVGNLTYLNRTQDYSGKVTSHAYLKNLLIPPTDDQTYIFRQGTYETPLLPPFNSVKLQFNLKVPMSTDVKKNYTTEVSRRGI